MLFFKLSISMYGSMLSNELLFMIIAQRAAKLTSQSWRFEKIALRSLFYLVKKGSNGTGFKSFLDLQL